MPPRSTPGCTTNRRKTIARVVPAAMTKARRRSSRLRLRGRRLGLALPGMGRRLPHDPALDPGQRVVELGHDPLLERDDRVVGDVDIFRADLAAALRDVAEAEAGLRPDELEAVVRVQRMHLERRVADEHPRAGEGRLVLLVVADDVAGVLAEEALDALVELLDPVDVLLVHPARAVGLLRLRLERGGLFGLLVVERSGGPDVLADREGLHRLNPHR